MTKPSHEARLRFLTAQRQNTIFLSSRLLLMWMLLGSLIGGVVGSASAFFLAALDYVSTVRLSHPWLIGLLPLGGLLVGLLITM